MTTIIICITIIISLFLILAIVSTRSDKAFKLRLLKEIDRQEEDYIRGYLSPDLTAKAWFGKLRAIVHQTSKVNDIQKGDPGTRGPGKRK